MGGLKAVGLVGNMGMNSEAILRMLSTFPAGAETFVLQALHILTDNGSCNPSFSFYTHTPYSLRSPLVIYYVLVCFSYANARACRSR